MRTHSLLRVAAATTVAVFMTVGGLGPAHAVNDKNDQAGKHEPVTICHAKGNGGYVKITVDDDAYEAHVQNHGDVAPSSEGGCPQPAGSEEKDKGQGAGSDKSQGKGRDKASDKGRDKASDRAQANGGEGTVRVEVCHLEGNGSYHVIEFDDSALDAHLDHGDLYPVPAEGCPVTEHGVGGDETGGTHGEDQTPGGHQAGGGAGTVEDEILGVEAEVGTGAAAAHRAPAAVAPTAAATAAPATGILPATGAGDYAAALLAGALLLVAGGVLLARRRLG